MNWWDHHEVAENGDKTDTSSTIMMPRKQTGRTCPDPHIDDFIIGSAEALPILCVRYNRWEREWDGSSETEVVRRKWRHHCRAKIGDKCALSLAKNSHLSFPPSHFPSLPSRRGHLYETSKNSIKLIPKTIGNRKRDCAWADARVLKNWRKIDCWAQIITRRSRYGFWWFVLNNWFFFNFLTPAHPLTHNLFFYFQ